MENLKATGVVPTVALLHLPELVKGDGVVVVQVGLLDGSVYNALQLLLRHLEPQHRPQNLPVTTFRSKFTSKAPML